MTVTVAIVNYNAGDWLQRCVASVLGSTQVNRVVVVDNASVDGSADSIAATFHDDRLEVIHNSQNRGFAAANNQVLQRCLDGEFNTDYVLLLNPDCELRESVFDTMLPKFKQNPEMGMAGCVIYNDDGSVQVTCRRNFPTPSTALIRMLQLHRLPFLNVSEFNLGAEPLPDTMQWVEAISGAFMLVKVAALKDVGLLDEAYFMHCEDLDWCMRFSQSGWRIGFVPDVSVVHAKGVSSQSRPIAVLWTLHRGMIRFFGKFYREKYSAPLRWLVVLGIYASFVARAGLHWVKRLLWRS